LSQKPVPGLEALLRDRQKTSFSSRQKIQVGRTQSLLKNIFPPVPKTKIFSTFTSLPPLQNIRRNLNIPMSPLIKKCLDRNQQRKTHKF